MTEKNCATTEGETDGAGVRVASEKTTTVEQQENGVNGEKSHNGEQVVAVDGKATTTVCETNGFEEEEEEEEEKMVDEKHGKKTSPFCRQEGEDSSAVVDCTEKEEVAVSRKKRFTGVLKCYSHSLGYGFARRMGSDDHYLVPAANIATEIDNCDLSAEWPVEFAVVDGPRGPEASQLVLLNDWPMEGVQQQQEQDKTSNHEEEEEEEEEGGGGGGGGDNNHKKEKENELTEDNDDKESDYLDVNESNQESLLEPDDISQNNLCYLEVKAEDDEEGLGLGDLGDPGECRKGIECGISARVKWFNCKRWHGTLFREGTGNQGADELEQMFVKLTEEAVACAQKRGIVSLDSGQRVSVDIDWSNTDINTSTVNSDATDSKASAGSGAAGGATANGSIQAEGNKTAGSSGATKRMPGFACVDLRLLEECAPSEDLRNQLNMKFKAAQQNSAAKKRSVSESRGSAVGSNSSSNKNINAGLTPRQIRRRRDRDRKRERERQVADGAPATKKIAAAAAQPANKSATNTALARSGPRPARTPPARIYKNLGPRRPRSPPAPAPPPPSFRSGARRPMQPGMAQLSHFQPHHSQFAAYPQHPHPQQPAPPPPPGALFSSSSSSSNFHNHHYPQLGGRMSMPAQAPVPRPRYEQPLPSSSFDRMGMQPVPARRNSHPAPLMGRSVSGGGISDGTMGSGFMQPVHHLGSRLSHHVIPPGTAGPLINPYEEMYKRSSDQQVSAGGVRYFDSRPFSGPPSNVRRY